MLNLGGALQVWMRSTRNPSQMKASHICIPRNCWHTGSSSAVLFSGLFLSAPVQRYGCRAVAMVGGVVVMVGTGGSYLASNVTMLCFSYGILGGKLFWCQVCTTVLLILRILLLNTDCNIVAYILEACCMFTCAHSHARPKLTVPFLCDWQRFTCRSNYTYSRWLMFYFLSLLRRCRAGPGNGVPVNGCHPPAKFS